MTLLKKPVSRISNSRLGGIHGRYRGRRITITIIPGNGKDVADVFCLKPYGTRSPEYISVEDVYTIALRRRVNNEIAQRKKRKKSSR